MAITHEIFRSFDSCPSTETRGIFLDISKAFDRVWHEGLLFKLKSYGIKGPLLELIKDFLSNRLQRVVLNGQTSSWKAVLAGVPQGSILGPLFFLIFINDLPNNVESIIKIFADDTSLFSIMTDSVLCSTHLNNDLKRIAEWASQWKMSFNPDPSKQAVEVCFSRKNTQTSLPSLSFNGVNVSSRESHKHLGLILDKKLTFNHHLKEKISKANKGIGLITRLRAYLPRHTLMCIYKSFVRPHLDYGDIVYDNPCNDIFKQKIESVQYNAALAITGAIRGTSRDKLYMELGLESLSDRRWYRKLSFFHKIKCGLTAPYLNDLLSAVNTVSYNFRTTRDFHLSAARTASFQSTFFPFCLSNWNKLDPDLRNIQSSLCFKRALLNFIRPSPAPLYNIHNPHGLTLLTRLRLRFSHLREHKFRHNFADTCDPFCNCRTNAIETTEHYLLHCPNYSVHRTKLIDNLHQNDISFLPYSQRHLTNFFLYGDNKLDIDSNQCILNNVIVFLFQTKRFDGPLF